MKSRLLLIILVFSAMLPSSVPAVEPSIKAADKPANKPAPELQGSLESVYNTWRKAMTQKNFNTWKSSTAGYRQMETRNRIVSQRRRFPDALFTIPMEAPSLSNLVLLNIFAKGDTANAIYFGKANFGVTTDQAISDNLIVLKFIRETGQWKFDRLRIIKFGNDPGLLQKIHNQDFSFLQDPTFQPSGVVPIIAKAVKTPAYLAELWITANGFQVTVNINRGNHISRLKNDDGRYLIIGGLVKGPNTISLSITPVETKSTLPKRLEIGIYAAEAANKPAKRIFHYIPDPNKVPPNYAVSVMVR